MKCKYIIGDSNSLIGQGVSQYSDDFIQVSLDITKKSFLECISYENVVELIKETNEWNKSFDFEEDGYCEITIPDSIEPLADGDSIGVYDSIKVREAIKQNPILKKYKLNIIDSKEVSHEDFDDFYEFYKDYNVNVLIDGNRGYCTLEEYKKTVEGIDYFVNIINQYDLSPFEKIMFAYDLVRNRVYRESEAGISKKMARDITSVLSGDHIVCVGFTKIFSKVLDALNISNGTLHLKRKSGRGGHVRNKVLVDDDKYNIHGIYYFDPTWDCKKEIDDNSHLNRIPFFALTKSQINNYDRNDYIVHDFDKQYLLKFERFLHTKDLNLLTSKCLNSFLIIIKELGLPDFVTKLKMAILSKKFGVDFVQGEIDYSEIKRNFELFKSYLNPEKIPVSKIMQAFIKVRKIENYIMPNDYVFSKDCLQQLASYSPSVLSDKALYEFLFQEPYDNKILEQKIESFNVPLEIERVNLARTLKKVLESKR